MAKSIAVAGGTAVLEDPKTGQPLDVKGPRRETDEDRENRIEDNRDRFLPWVEKTTQEKTQMAADRQFSGPHRWRVTMPDDAAQVAVEIDANSEEEAIARYDRLCGIRYTINARKAEKIGPGRP